MSTDLYPVFEALATSLREVTEHEVEIVEGDPNEVYVNFAHQAALTIGPSFDKRGRVESWYVMLMVWDSTHGVDSEETLAECQHAYILPVVRQFLEDQARYERELDAALARRADQTRAAAKWDRVSSAVSSETRSEEDIEAGLLAALGVDSMEVHD